MPRLLANELFRLRRRWMPWVLLAIIAAIGVVFYELIYVSVNAQLEMLRSGNAPANTVGPGGVEAAISQFEEALEQTRPEHVDELGVSVVAGIGSVLMIVFAASHVGTEFGWGTLRTLLASGVGRGPFLAAKLVSLAVFAVVLTVVGVAAAVGGSYLVSAQAGVATSGPEWANILSASWRSVFSLVPYMALATVIAVWARSSGAGIAAGLVIYFAESIVTQLLISLNRDFATIADFGISRNVASLSRVSVTVAGSNAQNSGVALPDQTQAALVLIVWTAVFVGLAYWRLRSRDVTLA